MKKRLFPLLLTLACLLAVPAHAAEIETVHISARSAPVIYVENVQAGFLDSQGCERRALLCNGTVYIPLRTAGAWMGAAVEWDQAAMTVVITSGKEAPAHLTNDDLNRMNATWPGGDAQLLADTRNGIDVQLRPDVTVKVDGQVRQFTNVLGQPVYPMLFRECVYLPVRNIGELCGKRVLWFSFQLPGVTQPSSRVHLYDAPTGEQLAAASAYFAAAGGCVKEMRAVIQSLLAETDVTEEKITQQVTALQASAQAILDLNVPTFRGAQLYVDQVRHYAGLVLSKSLSPYSDAAKRMRDPFYAEAAPAERRDAVVRLLLKTESNTYFTQLESVCNHGGAFMSQAAALEDQ